MKKTNILFSFFNLLSALNFHPTDKNKKIMKETTQSRTRTEAERIVKVSLYSSIKTATDAKAR